jgi:hypothetical protein
MDNDRKFEIRCDAGPDGRLHVKGRAISVSLGQRIGGSGTQEFWQSVLIICEEVKDGSVATKIIVCHPDWDQNVQIACIRSRISQGEQRTPVLDLDLKHIPL